MRARALAQPEHGPDAGKQGVSIEWLGDIAIGTADEPAQDVLALRLPGEHDYRNRLQLRMRAHPRQNVETVGVGQAHVEQGHIGQRLALQGVQVSARLDATRGANFSMVSRNLAIRRIVQA